MHLIIETTFVNADKSIALMSKHFCPSLLAEDIKKLKGNPSIHITHLDPSQEIQIMQELKELIFNKKISQLYRKEIIEI